jgi:hypothetical protein
MRAGKRTFIITLLVLVASLMTGSYNHAFPRKERSLCPATIALNASGHSRHAMPQLTESRTSDPFQTQKEKRHGKSLVSQAIVADCPTLVRPDFTYCQHHYPLFLPIGCISQFTGNFSLRGPPSLS